MATRHPAAPKPKEETPLSFSSPESSNISGATYTPETQTLTVTFHHGKTYAYEHVPGSVWAEFLAADSKGSFFANRIKGVYAWAKL